MYLFKADTSLLYSYQKYLLTEVQLYHPLLHDEANRPDILPKSAEMCMHLQYQNLFQINFHRVIEVSYLILLVWGYENKVSDRLNLGIVHVELLTQKVVCLNLVLFLNFFILFSAGKFTFQCMLNKTGEIVFSYHKVKVDLKKHYARKH